MVDEYDFTTQLEGLKCAPSISFRLDLALRLSIHLSIANHSEVQLVLELSARFFCDLDTSCQPISASLELARSNPALVTHASKAIRILAAMLASNDSAPHQFNARSQQYKSLCHFHCGSIAR